MRNRESGNEDEMSSNHAATRNLLYGLLAGGIIGGGSGIVVCTEKGKHLRADIGCRADELVDQTEDFLHNARTHGINYGRPREERRGVVTPELLHNGLKP